MRLFVAVDIGESAREAVSAEQRRVRQALDGDRSVAWVRPQHMHLTLVFLGETPPAQADVVIDLLSQPLTGIAPFRIAFGGIGVFPPHGPPRVLWLGLSAGAHEMMSLQAVVADRLATVGVARDPRPFHPHLTFGRWRAGRPRDRRRVLDLAPRSEVATADVRDVTLFESRLSSMGPAYTALTRAVLG